MVFPTICLQSGWCEFLKTLSPLRAMPSLELINRIASQSTLWAHFGSIKWFARQGESVTAACAVGETYSTDRS